ncbi:hypothetical protein N5K37_32455 [Delftia tsuruhatensis]|uniref:Uncharacterized protein n=1 Tax=Delftia tsuruhatensis TaxID=180282 RepID=A0ABN4SIZ3_9BURK|nr:hypothetical protein [Delftia tsuruhatensis]AOV01741.1 hypothetical protein BI380_10435 [Delftia tsuruhatensis]AOV02443.1 hypothetical protein BI380_14395 [Delftia tsuruhatensis]MDH2234623.1 hypothetical protein [Delftia tsuruhatensis]
MTYAEIIAAWNSQADHMNQWGALSEQEKVEWAWNFALDKAAKVCDDLPVPGEFQRDGAWPWEKGCDAAADAIRAMKDKP